MLETVHWRPLSLAYKVYRDVMDLKVHRDVRDVTRSTGTLQGLQTLILTLRDVIRSTDPYKDVRDPKDPNVPLRYVNIPKKTKDLMLITYLFSTYLRCFSPDLFPTGFVLYSKRSILLSLALYKQHV